MNHLQTSALPACEADSKAQPKRLTLTREIVSKLTPLKESEALLIAGGLRPADGSVSCHINNWSTWICGCSK